jgi:hypothetical protein
MGKEFHDRIALWLFSANQYELMEVEVDQSQYGTIVNLISESFGLRKFVR